MKKIILSILAILFLAILLFVVWPSPIDAVAYEPEEAPALEGQYEINQALDKLEKIYGGLCDSCEDVAIATDGTIYGSQVNGDIIAMKDGIASAIINTGGRPLGLDFDAYSNLIIADANKGLLSLDSTGKLSVLTTSSEGLDFKFVDDIEVGPDGIYYFSDASSKYSFKETMMDIMEHGGHGRLLSYDPMTQQTKTLLSGLQFANGVATSPDSSFVLINETGDHCIRKYWLNGSKKGTDEYLIKNLPGYPDGVSRGEDGIYWLTLVNPRSPEMDQLMPKPGVRNVLMKLPSSVLAAIPQHYSFVIGLNQDGEIIYNLQDAEPNLLEITSVQQVGDNLYFGSLTDDGIGMMKLK